MLGGEGRGRPSWFDSRVSIGNIITWLTLLGGIVWMAAEVRADIAGLKEFKDETKTEIRKIAAERAIDREAVIEMRTDIRLIRQILEAQLRRDGAPPR